MKTIRVLVAAMALVTASSLPGAHAASAGDDDAIFEFDAFGTLGLVHSSEGNADFTRNALVPRGAGASGSWSAKVDSVLAGQLAAHITPQLTAVVQVVSELHPDNSFDPHVEWANLNYAFTPDLAFGVGRIASPVFMLTETRRLSYSLPWIRPSVEVYDLFPVTSNDGLNLRWRSRMGGITHLLEVAVGRSNTRYNRNGSSGTAQGREQFIVRSTLERGALSVNLGFSSSTLTIPEFFPLFDAFRQFGPAGEVIARRFTPDHSASRYFGVGASYDPGRWFAMAEWARLEVDGVISTHSGWYASTGLRYGMFTPYVIWAQTMPRSKRSDPGLDLTTLPAESVPVAAALNAQLNAALANVADQSTFSAGVRWDFAPDVCLKIQYDHMDLASGNTGTLTNFQPGFQPGGAVNLVGVSVSFVL